MELKYNIGQLFYLKGTKKRFFIADIDFGGRYYLYQLKDKNRAYLSYMQKQITEQDLDLKYKI